MQFLSFLQHRNINFAVAFATALLLLSCERTQTENSIAPTVAQNEGFATFKTRAEFDETVAKLSKGSYSDVVLLEKQHHFVSMTTLLKKAEEEDEANQEREIKIEASSPELAKTMKHETPKTIVDNPNSFIYATESGIELNLILLDLASVLNKDGIVKIENKIVQYKHDFIKVINDGDERKIASLERTKTTDLTQNVLVNPVKFTKSTIVKNTKTAGVRSCEATSGSPMQWWIIVYEEAFTSNDNFLKYWIGQYKIRTLKRGSFGSWYNYSTRSQYGNVTHYGPQFSIGYNPGGWAFTPYVEPSGSKPYNNSSGSETSTLIYPYFNYGLNAQAGLTSYPYNNLEINFSPSNTAKFGFSVGNCECTL
jgi:hypothetical protein